MRIILYSPVKFEDWDFRSCDKGIGGSETSAVQMAKEMAKRGHEVISYAPLPADMPSGTVWEGNKWYRLEEVDWSMPGWWMLYRCPQAIDNFDPARKDQPLSLMFQDWDYRDSLIGERVEKLGRAVVLCRSHERYLLKKCPELKDKTWVTRNGIRNDLILETEAQGIPERNNNSMMFASSPDRGLKEALLIYDRVKEAIPDFEFNASYGFNNIDKLIAMGATHFQKDKDECMRLIERTGATFTGRMTQQELYRKWLSVGFWAYCTNFHETGAITALEAMALGAIPIFSPIYAQGENIKHGSAIRGARDSEATIARFAFEIIKLAHHPEKMEAIRRDMMPDTRKKWGWERFAIGWENAAARDLGEYRQKAFSFPVELKPGMTVVDIAAGRDDFAATAAALDATLLANEPSALFDEVRDAVFPVDRRPGLQATDAYVCRNAIGDPAAIGSSILYIDTPEISGIRTPAEDVVLPVATVDALVAEWLEPDQRIDILRLDNEAQMVHAAETIKRSEVVVIGDRILEKP